MCFRCCVLFVLTTVLLAVAETTPRAQALAKGAVKTAAHQYVDPDTSDNTRGDLLEALGKAKNSDLTSALKSPARKDDQRARALELALALHVRSLFSMFNKNFSDDPEGIGKLGLITADKGAAKAVEKHWAEADVNSDEFKALTGLFEKYGVDLDTLEKFESVLKDEDAPEERKSAAAEILKFQFGLETSSPTEITLREDELKKLYREEGEQFPMRGMNLLALDGWRAQLCRRVGGNFRLLEANGMLNLKSGLPKSATHPPYTVSVHIKPDEGFEGDVGFLCSSGGKLQLCGIGATDGKWRISVDTGPIDTAYKAGKWAQLEISVTSGTKQLDWSATIDGKSIAKNMLLLGTPVGFVVQSRKGTATFGSLDYRRD